MKGRPVPLETWTPHVGGYLCRVLLLDSQRHIEGGVTPRGPCPTVHHRFIDKYSCNRGSWPTFARKEGGRLFTVREGTNDSCCQLASRRTSSVKKSTVSTLTHSTGFRSPTYVEARWFPAPVSLFCDRGPRPFSPPRPSTDFSSGRTTKTRGLPGDWGLWKGRSTCGKVSV